MDIGGKAGAWSHCHTVVSDTEFRLTYQTHDPTHTHSLVM